MVTEKLRKGSLTVEAAMVLPIAMFIVMTMLTLVQRTYIHERIQYALDVSVPEAALVSYTVMSSDMLKVGESKLSELGLPEEVKSFFIGTIVSDLLAESLVRRHLEEEELVRWGIEEGWSGMDFRGSRLRGDDNRTTLKVVYRLAFPFPLSDGIARYFEKPVIQSASTRIWCGHLGLFATKSRTGEKTDANTVYIAASGNGRAYHILECLEKPTTPTKFYEGFERDICLSCLKKTGLPSIGDTIWVVTGATADAKYHTSQFCTSIYHKAEAISLEEAVLKSLSPCSKCNPPLLQSNEQTTEQ